MVQQVFTDRYQIVRHLARGGMAEVYLARDLLLDRRVALKVLFPEFAADQSFVERFRREARAAAGLNHPNIVSIYDWGEENGTYFIVMEYVDGRTLREIVRAEGPLHPTRAAEVGAEIAAALAFAHRNGVIHRDVKPGNVMISNLVKVTDFGIARAGDPGESLTQTGAVMGTATYFSPEQAQGLAIDPRSDVYSLGVVLYETVTGRPPFTGDSPVAIAYQHVRESPVPPSRHNPDVPRDFEAIVMKALAKNKANRYSSAEALRADLLRFATGQPVSAEPLMAPPAVQAATPTPSRPARAPAPPPPDPAHEGTRMLPRSRSTGPEYEEYEEYENDRAAYRAGADDDWEPVDDRRGPRTGIYIFILIMLLTILGGLLWLLARELGVGGSSEVAVPGVVGQQQEVAIRTIEDAGLKVEVIPEANDLNDPGLVLGQNPERGTRVASGSTVRLTIAGVAEEVDLPDVRTRTLTEARRLLEERNFVVRTTFAPSDLVPADEVISQNPAPGRARTGSVVTLTVSSGPDEVVVPSLFRVPEEEAARALTDRGFRVDRQTVLSDDVPQGSVTNTSPGAGTPLPRGATVTLLVSGGPPPTTSTTTAPTTTTVPSSTTSTSRPPTTTSTSLGTTTTT